ncbi:MAG: TIGR04283 family arsenosugar biosynthesis glycosyltransferase [Ferruginibacter sp.]
MISVIIPTYNEEAQIQATIQKLFQNDTGSLIKEIIITDGGSTDGTIAAASNEKVIVVTSPKKGRAAQMNYGASMATADILYFIHADTIPPDHFSGDILQATDEGCGAGCYMLSFDHDHWFLKTLCWFTRFDIDAFRFGDQSLFVTKNSFLKTNGFNESRIVMEDQEFIQRLKKLVSFTIIKKPVLTSARKYIQNGIYKTQFIFFIIYFMYRLGYSQERMVATYKNWINESKI